MGCVDNCMGICTCDNEDHKERVEDAISDNRAVFTCNNATARYDECLCGGEIGEYQESYEAWGANVVHTYKYCKKCGDDYIG